MTSPTEAPRTAAETLMALHVRRTTSSMEPDPERPGYARQTAWCEWCVNHADDDPHWPCLTVRALAEAAASASPGVMERLAAIEHEQWEQWSRTIAEQGLTPDRIERWKRFWVPYDELDEETKEHDRVWARRVIAALPAAAILDPAAESTRGNVTGEARPSGQTQTDSAAFPIPAAAPAPPDVPAEAIEWARELVRQGYRDEHIVTFTETGYGLEHPIRCRPNLIGCQFNEWLASQMAPDRDPGRYVMTWRKNGPHYAATPPTDETQGS